MFFGFIRFITNIFKQDSPKVVLEETNDSEMKYLIVGLGNVGEKYVDTRHNIGFLVVDAIAKKFDVPFKSDQLGDVALVKHKGRFIYLLKPNTFMNLSGKSTRFWLQKLKIEKTNLLVVVDDLNIDFGKVRLRGKGSDGGHNGLKSLNDLLQGSNFARLRMGIGNQFGTGRQINYVLGEWNKEETKELPFLIDDAVDASLAFCSIGLGQAMNQFNK